MAAGLDSLGSVELRNTLESSLALSLPPTLVMDYPTAAAIAAYAAAKLPSSAGSAVGAAAAAADDDIWGLLEDAGSAPQLPPSAAAAVQPLPGVESEVSAAVASILGRSIGPSEPLMASGLDSLASVELQNVLQARFGLQLPATLALDYPSATAIAGFIHAKLAAAAAGAAPGAPAGARPPRCGLLLAAAAAQAQLAIGVASMAFRLPGVNSLLASPPALLQGLDAITVVPLDRWDERPVLCLFGAAVCVGPNTTPPTALLTRVTNHIIITSLKPTQMVTRGCAVPRVWRRAAAPLWQLCGQRGWL
jgi:acyl carrier protein